jgi:hypothetical protein
MGPVDCDIDEIYLVIGFCFSGKLHVGVDSVEVVLCVVDVRVAGVINYQNVIDVGKIPCDFVLACKVR